jgi:hypothetical protein
MRRSLFALVGLMGLVGAGCSAPEENLSERLNGVRGADNQTLVIVKYAEKPKHAAEIKDYLTAGKIREVNSFDYSSVSSVRLNEIETTFAEKLGYDLDLPEDPKDYGLSHKLAVFYAENLFKN